ncbi:MAG: GrpB family protein [Prevotellaceae bacterium]|nr:GrpB family protein [Prevotellaceae bacterium]
MEKTLAHIGIVRINHIGSTAVPCLLAKPTLDILLEIKDNTDTIGLKNSIEAIDYIYSYQPDNPPPHMMYMKGYTPNGFQGQAFHLHVRYAGDWDELYFRDYLLAHPDAVREYGELKLRLKQQYEHDRDGYTHAKTAFVRKITARARKLNQNE